MIREIRFNYSIAGVSGVAAAIQSRLFGKVTHLKAKESSGLPPLWLRFGTTDPHTYAQVFQNVEYNFTTTRPLTTIIDAGANIGLAAIYLARRFPDARIVAIEPDKGNFAQLRKNAAPYKNIECLEGALWNEDGEINLFDDGEGEWGFTTYSDDTSKNPSLVGAVPAYTVPTVMKKFGLERVDLLKVDIEGSEQEVFETAAEWIDSIDALAVELHDTTRPGSDHVRPGCADSFRSATKDFPHAWEIGENHFRSRETAAILPS